jgi:cytochrome bd ubiquinol oxidase subunit II
LLLLSLGVMMWPYMIPYALTAAAAAAAPEASLRFFFYGGIVVLPVIAAYTIGVYWIFRGKIDRFDPAVRSRESGDVRP